MFLFKYLLPGPNNYTNRRLFWLPPLSIYLPPIFSSAPLYSLLEIPVSIAGWSCVSESVGSQGCTILCVTWVPAASVKALGEWLKEKLQRNKEDHCCSSTPLTKTLLHDFIFFFSALTEGRNQESQFFSQWKILYIKRHKVVHCKGHTTVLPLSCFSSTKLI